MGSPSAVQPRAHDDPFIRGGRDMHQTLRRGDGSPRAAVLAAAYEKADFDVGRYVSVGRLCERHAAAYYEALNACT